MPDEMELGVREILQLRILALELLHVVFTENTQTQIVCVPNHARLKFLRDRHQGDIGAGAPRMADRLLNSLLNLSQPLFERRGQHYRSIISASHSGIEAAMEGCTPWPA